MVLGLMGEIYLAHYIFKQHNQVLGMEYNEFAKGAATITEIDFARILLRYTFLHAEEYELILERWVSSSIFICEHIIYSKIV